MPEEDSTIALTAIVRSAPEKVTICVVRNCLARIFQTDNAAPLAKSYTLPEKAASKIEWMRENIEPANDEKATRDDDVGADIAQWDTYIVNNYESIAECTEIAWADPNWKKLDPQKSQAIVCRGGEVTDAHRWLFCKLRKLCMRRVTVNLYQSFKTYLRMTYGSNWCESATSQRNLMFWNNTFIPAQP
jgi:hypothetical protein